MLIHLVLVVIHSAFAWSSSSTWCYTHTPVHQPLCGTPTLPGHNALGPL